MNAFKYLFILTSFFYYTTTFSQQPSLRINEVSQGSGNEEYVEFIVTGIPSTVCSPQTLDLRGWIFDDNNGYFKPGAGNGIATGSMRFSNNVLWQAVPVGTLILIYNNADFNNAIIPAQDVSLTDGNCRLVIPVNSNLLEKNSLPDVNSSIYPTTGWSAGGDWTNIGMQNGNDSFQIYAPNNTTTPVHAVSWGNNTNNNIIYFSGNAGGKVFSAMNTSSTDLSLQSNWASQNANNINQTPGSPNSPQNAAYISFLNNNCSIPTGGISISVSGTNVTCAAACSGTATLTISGGTAPYTILWSNGQTSNSIQNLCAGTYSVTVTDNLGCEDTQSVTIGTDANFTLTTSGNTAICEGESTIISASGATTYAWVPNLGTGSSHSVSPLTTTTYTVTGTTNGCSSSETIVVTVNPKPQINAGINQVICIGETTMISATGATTYTWIPNLGAGNSHAVTPNETTTYTVTGTTNGCSASESITVTVKTTLDVNAGIDQVICVGESFTFNATGGDNYVWEDGYTNGETIIPAEGIHTYTVVGTSGTCVGSDVLEINVISCAWEFELPNVFTPNGDQVNDFFIPTKESNIAIKEFNIFNRWGNLVYKSNAPILIWNGKTNVGELIDDEVVNGIYFYVIQFTTVLLEEKMEQGFVHVLR